MYKGKSSIPASSFRYYWHMIRQYTNISQDKTIYTFRRTVAQRNYDAYFYNRDQESKAKLNVAQALQHSNTRDKDQ